MANKLTHTTISSPNGINEVCSMITIDTVSNPFVFHNILLPTETNYVFTAYVRSSVAGSITVGGKTVNITTTWTKKVIQFTNTNASNKNLQMSFGVNGIYYFYHTKLETGHLSTHYSSAPEDNHDTLQHIQTVAEQTADGFKWLVNGSQDTGFYISDGGIEAITEKFTIKGSDGSMTVINGGRIETGSIIGNDIKANSITAREITTDNIIGSNGWINLAQGTFNYGQGKLSWNGSSLNVEGVVKASSGEFNGTVNATTISASQGTFAGWTVCSDGLKRAGAATLTQNNITSTNKYDSSTYSNFWDSSWFNFSSINNGYNGWNSTTDKGVVSSAGNNSGDMYFGNNGLAITSNFTVDSSGRMKAQSGTIGGVTISNNGLTVGSTSGTNYGYLSAKENNFLYFYNGTSDEFNRVAITNAGRITLEYKGTVTSDTEGGTTTTSVTKTTIIGDGNVRTTGFVLLGNKTTEWMDGKTGIRLHPQGTMHIQANGNTKPEIAFTYGEGTTTTQSNRWDGSIRVSSDKTFEIRARSTANGGSGAIKLDSNTVELTGQTTSTYSSGFGYAQENSDVKVAFGIGSSGVSRGIYDYVSNTWMIYKDSESNRVLIPHKLYLDGHTSYVGYVTQNASATSVSATGGKWVNRGSIPLPTGTWVVSAHVVFANTSSEPADYGTMQVCLSTNAPASDGTISGELMGTRNVIIHPAKYGTGHTLGTTGTIVCNSQTTIYVDAYSRYTRNTTSMSYRICRIA